MQSGNLADKKPFTRVNLVTRSNSGRNLMKIPQHLVSEADTALQAQARNLIHSTVSSHYNANPPNTCRRHGAKVTTT
jgi:hypothetical protein